MHSYYFDCQSENLTNLSRLLDKMIQRYNNLLPHK